MNNRFYVYLHRRKDSGQVFYIGKGTQDRAKRSRKYKKWQNIVNEAGGFTVEYVRENLSETDALLLESELIKSPDVEWNLINSVSSFKTATFDKQEILENFYYDETSTTCLRFKKWNRSRIKKSARYENDEAGYILNKNNPPPYYSVKMNGKPCLVHRLIWTMFNGEIPSGFVINHKNNNSLDNRLSNLELVTQAVNCRRTKKQTKEYAGVYTMTVGNYTYSVANWVIDFKRHTKLFSHHLHGDKEATRLAIEFRESKMRELSHLGYVFAITKN